MPYTTPELVKGLIDVDDTVDLTPFINAADQLIVNLCLKSGYSNDLLTTIETWLSAHFYTILDNQLQSIKAGAAAAVFMQKIDYGLKCSMYGQQAMRLDWKGNLAAMDNTIQIRRIIKVGGFWTGIRRKFPGFLGDWEEICTVQ